MSEEIEEGPSVLSPESPIPSIQNAQKVEDVVNILREEGFSAEMVQFGEHPVRRSEEMEEGDAENANLESMKLFGEFLVTYRPSSPLIYIGYNGYIGAEWPISGDLRAEHSYAEYWGDGDGIVVMEFLPSGLIELAILSGPYEGGKNRLKLDGFLPLSEVMKAVQIVTREITPDDR